MITSSIPVPPSNSINIIQSRIVTPRETAKAIGVAAAFPVYPVLGVLNAAYQISAGLITRDRERINWGLLGIPLSFTVIPQQIKEAGKSIKNTNFYPSATFYAQMAGPEFYTDSVTSYYDRILGRDPDRYQRHHTPELFKAEMQAYLSFVLYCFQQAKPTTSVKLTTPEKLRHASASQKRMPFDRRAIIDAFVKNAFANRPETDVLVDIERSFIAGLFNTENLSVSDRQLLQENTPQLQ